MVSTLALFHTRQALGVLDAEDLGSSAAACYLQFALDLLEEQEDSLSSDDMPKVFELVG